MADGLNETAVGEGLWSDGINDLMGGFSMFRYSEGRKVFYQD